MSAGDGLVASSIGNFNSAFCHLLYHIGYSLAASIKRTCLVLAPDTYNLLFPFFSTRIHSEQPSMAAANEPLSAERSTGLGKIAYVLLPL